MTQGHFNKSKYANIMSWDSFLILGKLCQSRQTLPDFAKIETSKYFSGKCSNLLTNVVVKYLKWTGNHAERVNTTGQMRKINGEYKYTFSGSTNGSADIHSIIDGRAVQFEIKYGKDKQSEKQKKYEMQVKQAGGEYHVIRQFDDLLEIFDNNKITKNK